MPENKENQEHFFPFSDGTWMPGFDPAQIGAKNFRELLNMRYKPRGVEGVRGYSKINTTALSSYPKIRSGVQLLAPGRTVDSYVLVQAENSGETASVVYENRTDIPDQGDFQGTALHTDATGAGLGRFSKAPGQNVTYANGVENCIYGGDEMECAAFMTITYAAGPPVVISEKRDRTQEISNTLQTAGNYVSIGAATQPDFIVFSTRPLSGVKFYVLTANTVASSMSCAYWNGTAWTAVGSASDGTVSGGKSLNISGWYTFTSTDGLAEPMMLDEFYLYAYHFTLSGGNADVYHLTVKAPWQTVKDVWDGVYREPIQFQRSYFGTYEDYTMAVLVPSYTSTGALPTGGVLDGLNPATSDHVIVMFEERQAAIRFEIPPLYGNTNASVASISYYTGATWMACSNFVDTTIVLGKTLAQTGSMSWTPPAITAEKPIYLFGVRGYAYYLAVTVALTGTHGGNCEMVVDRCYGIPAPRKDIKPFTFPSKFGGRALWCGYKAGGEGNRVDYCATESPEVNNGEDASGDGDRSLYIGGAEDLTSGAELYNRFGSNVHGMWLGLKRGETYVLTGTGPDDYRVYTVSLNIGNPAPLTLVTAEAGIDAAPGVGRNTAIWLSYIGPVMFDGATIVPIPGLEPFFDSRNGCCINWDAIGKSVGWYDSLHHEYNLIFPSGSGDTDCNVWFCWDIVRKKWFEKHTFYTHMPQAAFQVEDEFGRQYTYAGIDAGYMMRLENGTSWDGAAIVQRMVVGDFWPTGNPWDISLIRQLKFVAEVMRDEERRVDVYYLGDTDSWDGRFCAWTDGDVVFTDGDVVWTSAPSALASFDLGQSVSTQRLLRFTEPTNKEGWTHAFGFECMTSVSTIGFRPFGWGVQYRQVRKDVGDGSTDAS